MTNLFAAGRIGRYELPNRIVMAPMTRNRATDDFVPQQLMATYYCQRASAGLIITEASQVSPYAAGYPRTPGIHRPDQVAAWRSITDAVHGQRGRIFLQLWHAGRISHPSLLPDQTLPVAPSAIQADGEVYTPDGLRPFVVPRALATDEIPQIVEDFRLGAANARAAGFDGVEIHAANGYLIDQFLRSGSNVRRDPYGGSIANRCRLLFEIVEAVSGVWGAEFVGVHISPLVDVHSVSDADAQGLFTYLARELSGRGLAYLHVFESTIPHPRTPSSAFDLRAVHQAYGGTYMANGGYDRERANDAIASGRADFVSFGRLFLANPDLPERLRRGAGLNRADPATFYEGGEHGYTDYGTLANRAAGQQ